MGWKSELDSLEKKDLKKPFKLAWQHDKVLICILLIPTVLVGGTFIPQIFAKYSFEKAHKEWVANYETNFASKLEALDQQLAACRKQCDRDMRMYHSRMYVELPSNDGFGGTYSAQRSDGRLSEILQPRDLESYRKYGKLPSKMSLTTRCLSSSKDQWGYENPCHSVYEERQAVKRKIPPKPKPGWWFMDYTW